MTNRLKCRWCDYTVLSVYRGRDGKVKSGFSKLRNHQEDFHLEPLEALLEAGEKLEADLERELIAQAERDRG